MFGPGAENSDAVERLMREVGVQAELLALNFALEGQGAQQASAALIALSRELRETGRFRPDAPEIARFTWRLE